MRNLFSEMMLNTTRQELGAIHLPGWYFQEIELEEKPRLLKYKLDASYKMHLCGVF